EHVPVRHLRHERGLHSLPRRVPVAFRVARVHEIVIVVTSSCPRQDGCASQQSERLTDESLHRLSSSCQLSVVSCQLLLRCELTTDPGQLEITSSSWSP